MLLQVELRVLDDIHAASGTISLDVLEANIRRIKGYEKVQRKTIAAVPLCDPDVSFTSCSFCPAILLSSAQLLLRLAMLLSWQQACTQGWHHSTCIWLLALTTCCLRTGPAGDFRMCSSGCWCHTGGTACLLACSLSSSAIHDTPHYALHLPLLCR